MRFAASMPSSGHLDVENGQIRQLRACQLDCLEPVPRLGADLEAGPLQKLAQIEPDDRLVFGDE